MSHATNSVITATIDGVTIQARVHRDPDGRIVAARNVATGDDVPALIDPDGDGDAALRAALAEW